MINNFPPLIARINQEGKCLANGVLKVDSFVNHQLDPDLIMLMAEEFNRRFDSKSYDKIITIEASGIAHAVMLGYLTHKKVVFAKKKKPSTMNQNQMLITEVYSFTKNTFEHICLSREFLNINERILFIDDFLASGKAAQGIIDLVQQAQATLVGMGFIIEKAFQDGGKKLRKQQIHVESLATIESLDNSTITLAHQNPYSSLHLPNSLSIRRSHQLLL